MPLRWSRIRRLRCRRRRRLEHRYHDLEKGLTRTSVSSRLEGLWEQGVLTIRTVPLPASCCGWRGHAAVGLLHRRPRCRWRWVGVDTRSHYGKTTELGIGGNLEMLAPIPEDQRQPHKGILPKVIAGYHNPISNVPQAKVDYRCNWVIASGQSSWALVFGPSSLGSRLLVLVFGLSSLGPGLWVVVSGPSSLGV